MTDNDFLQWIYNRMVEVHNENELYDYMHKFKGIIEKNKMTERAQTLAAAIREIVNEFQYYQCCEEEDVEDMLVAIRETCENWRNGDE